MVLESPVSTVGHVRGDSYRADGRQVEARVLRTEDAKFVNLFYPTGRRGREEREGRREKTVLPHSTNLWDSLLGYDAKSGSPSIGGRRNKNQNTLQPHLTPKSSSGQEKVSDFQQLDCHDSSSIL